MKHLLPFAFLLIAAGACRKEKSSDGISSNSWHVNAQTYTGGSSNKTLMYGRPMVSFAAAGFWTETPTISFLFQSEPVKAGIYKIVANPSAANEVAVFSQEGWGPGYYSTGTDGAAAIVQVRNGKITIASTSVRIRSDAFTGADSTNISFNLTEF